jgi:hypothetical protein
MAPVLLRTAIKELLLRAASGESWDPEESWPAISLDRKGESQMVSNWLTSVGFPQQSSMLAPMPCIVPPTSVCNGGSWHIQGFCDAAYAMMCFTKREGLTGEENASLNAAAAACALRELLPYSPCTHRMIPLVVLMAATEGVSTFAAEVARLMGWLHQHARTRFMRTFVMRSAAEIMTASCVLTSKIASRESPVTIGGEEEIMRVHQELQSVCSAIVSEHDPYTGSDEVTSHALSLSLSLSLSLFLSVSLCAFVCFFVKVYMCVWTHQCAWCTCMCMCKSFSCMYMYRFMHDV